MKRDWFCRLFHQPWHWWNACLICTPKQAQRACR